MKNEITLEEAQSIIRAHREAEERAKKADAEQFVGKFFRYRNNYGSGDPGWWLYTAVTEAMDGGWVSGWSFQETTAGECIAKIDKMFYVDRGGYSEIQAKDFWRAWEDFKARIARLPGSARKPRSKPKAAAKRATKT